MAIDNECLEVLSNDEIISKDVASRIGSFFKFFKVKKHLKECGIGPVNGYPAFLILVCIFIPVFLYRNIYFLYAKVRQKIIQKDAIYGFLKKSRPNWELFSLKVAHDEYQFIDKLTSKKRLSVFSLDDSPIKKDSSHEIELTGSFFDHVLQVFYKGFQLLQLAWYDGETKIPTGSRLMGSANKENSVPVKEEKSNLDPRSNGAKRRAEAIKTKFEVGYRMLEDAIKIGIRATAVVFDTWYAKPFFIIKCSNLLPVVCRLAISSKLQFWFQGSKICVKEIYRKLTQKATKNIPTSTIVEVEDSDGNKIKAKLVFIRHKATGDLIVLLSTNTKFSVETIIRLYSMRWCIETLFRECKQFLDLETGYQGTDYDGYTAYVAIVMLRYMFLSYKARKSIDDRTIGSLFYCCCDEIKDIEFEEVLCIIFSHIIEIVEESEDKITMIKKIRQYQDYVINNGYKIYKESVFPKLFGLDTDNTFKKCS